MKNRKASAKNIIKAMGLVFGDIGTSPIYTLTVIFLTLEINQLNVLGVLSLIVWTLILLVTLQYTWLAMSLSKRGEGGTIVLSEILKKYLKSSRAIAFFSLLSYLGISLLIGDSVITPAISILSAAEGLKLFHHLNGMHVGAIIAITIFITSVLFYFQKKGTEKISNIFGPIMVIWFLLLGVEGLMAIAKAPFVLEAVNPMFAIKFLTTHGFAGFFVLSEVILCATGAEALYADIGHTGKKPIIGAWYFVFAALFLNYLGQGAFILFNQTQGSVLFSMVLSQTKFLYPVFIVITLLSTIIASQAMISGLFSIVYQGINTRILPLFKVEYTSDEINTQIYIGTANWFLFFFVIVMVLFFKESSNLAAAYGLAASGTIAITGVLMSSIFILRKKYFHFLIATVCTMMDITFFSATCFKIPQGAWLSLLIATIPFTIILLYTKGNLKLHKAMGSMDKETFLKKYSKIYKIIPKVKGESIFFARSIDKIPQYIIQTMFTDNIVYENNTIVQVMKTGEAHGIRSEVEQLAEGLKVLKIQAGYKETLELTKILKRNNIDEKVIFYGVEEVETTNILWKIYSVIKKLTPSFVTFYKLPQNKVRGIITRIEM